MRFLTVLALIGCAGDIPPGTDPEPVCTRSSGEICTLIGTGDSRLDLDNGAALETDLFLPSAVTFYPDGSPLVVDYNNNVLRRIDGDDTVIVAGMGKHGLALDGVDALHCPLENPVDAAVMDDDSILIMEQHGARVLKVDPDGWLTVYAGEPVYAGYEEFLDGPAREAGMSQSVGLTLAPDGTLYIADTNNHAIRVVDAAGETMTTLAGNGEEGFVDGIGADARFFRPQHLDYHDGAVYVADLYNHAVRRVDVATGEVTTIAGTGEAGFSGDGGPATEAQLRNPQGVAVSESGEIYIADTVNHVIRRIDADGTIETVVGRPGEFGFGGDFGDAALALLENPSNVAIHGTELYITDQFNDRIRVVYDFVR